MSPAPVILALLATSGADSAFLADLGLDAVEMKALPATPGDAAWKAVKPRAVRVTPQHSVRMNDALANMLVGSQGANDAQVRAAYSKDALAVLVEWPDARADLGAEIEGFADGVALEFPRTFGAGVRLPYIGMGDVEQPVLVYSARARPGATDLRQMVAAGFGSLTRAPVSPGLKAQLEYDAGQKVWRALFTRPLELGGHSLARALVPIAFAVWDGARNERGGNKQLSAWRFLRLGRYPLDAAYVRERSWGYGPGDLGDAQKGRALVSTICAPCHRLPDAVHAPAGVAPDLSDIGAIAPLPYLRDSIVEPSKVLVPNPNPNSHYQKDGERDALGAFPNSVAYQWWVVGPDGKGVSKMPPFAGFGPEQLADMVAFLRTLDGVAR